MPLSGVILVAVLQAYVQLQSTGSLQIESHAMVHLSLHPSPSHYLTRSQLRDLNCLTLDAHSQDWLKVHLLEPLTVVSAQDPAHSTEKLRLHPTPVNLTTKQ